MQGSPHPDLTDMVLGSEIELLAELIDAASHAHLPLGQDQIDAILEVTSLDGSQSPRASR